MANGQSVDRAPLVTVRCSPVRHSPPVATRPSQPGAGSMAAVGIEGHAPQRRAPTPSGGWPLPISPSTFSSLRDSPRSAASERVVYVIVPRQRRATEPRTHRRLEGAASILARPYRWYPACHVRPVAGPGTVGRHGSRRPSHALGSATGPKSSPGYQRRYPPPRRTCRWRRSRLSSCCRLPKFPPSR